MAANHNAAWIEFQVRVWNRLSATARAFILNFDHADALSA